MIIVASLEAIALVIVVFLFLRREQANDKAIQAERRELLTRIQRPDIVPLAQPEPFLFPESDPDELELVGTINDLQDPVED